MLVSHSCRFSSASMSMQSVNCAACKTTVKRGHKSVKCKCKDYEMCKIERVNVCTIMICITLCGWIKGKSRDTYLMYP